MNKIIYFVFMATEALAQTGAGNRCSARGNCIEPPTTNVQGLEKVQSTVTGFDWLIRTIPLVAGIIFLVAAGKKISEKDWEAGFARFAGAVVSFLSLAISNYYFS